MPVNLALNHSLLRPTGDLTSAFTHKSTAVPPMYLTININDFLKINTQVYLFKPAYLVILTRQIVSLLLRSVQQSQGIRSILGVKTIYF